MERSRDSRSPPLNMYRYKSRVEASRGETSHLTKRRVDSSRGKARLPLLSLASLSNSTRFRSVPFRARYILIRPTGGYHLFRGPRGAHGRRASHAAVGYGRKGVSHGRRTCPLSQIFLPLTAAGPVSSGDHYGHGTDPYFLLAAASVPLHTSRRTLSKRSLLEWGIRGS